MLKHFLKYLMGDIAVKILGFVSLPLYTYFLLPEEYGLYSLIVSYVAIAVVVLPLNVHASVSRFFYDKSLDINTFMGTTLGLTLFVFIIALSVLYLIGEAALTETLGFDFSIFGISFLVLISIRIIFDIYKQTLIPQKKSKEFSLLLVGKSYLTFFLVVSTFYIFEPSPLNMIYGIAIAELIVCIYVMKNLSPYFPLKLDVDSSKYIINYSVFLMPYVLSGVLMSQIDTVMLANFYTTHEVGIYSVAYTLSMVPLILFTSFSNAWTPTYFKYMDSGSHDLLKRDVLRILMGLSLVIFLVSLFSQEIIWILVDSKYNESADVLPLLTLSVFFMVLWQMWGRGISYIRKTIWTSAIGLTSAALNIVLNLYLIPKYDMHGAVYATLISFIFMSFSGYFISKCVLKIYTVDIYSMRFVFLINLFTLFVTFIDNKIALYTIKGFVIILTIAASLIFRNKITSFIKARVT